MSSTPETSREPCPDRILDDIGGAFGMGAVGGSAYHFVRGLRNSPRGERLSGGLQTMRLNAPRVGGGFAVWGGLFSTFDCTMVYIRQKEDPWNSIISGAATGGFLQMRQGPGYAARAAVLGGVLLALIEGAGIMINRLVTPQNIPPIMEDPSVPAVSGAGGPSIGFPTIGGIPQGMPQVSAKEDAGNSSSSWFGGLFGGGKKKEEVRGSPQTELLESFDTSAPPIPSFEYK